MNGLSLKYHSPCLPFVLFPGIDRVCLFSCVIFIDLCFEVVAYDNCILLMSYTSNGQGVGAGLLTSHIPSHLLRLRSRFIEWHAPAVATAASIPPLRSSQFSALSYCNGIPRITAALSISLARSFTWNAYVYIVI